MKKLLIPLLLLGLPAYAMDDNPLNFDVAPTSPFIYDRVEVFEDPSSTDDWFARAVVRNVRGSYNEVEVESTPKGDVGIRYTTTQPSKVGDPNSADEACVDFLPDGVVAIPRCVTIMEEETETIFLYEYLGG